MIPILSVKGLGVRYGAISALSGINIEAHEGEVLSIIGANGAGKSTLLKTIMGFVKPVSGEIFFNGKPMKGMKTSSIVRMGITMVPEGRRIFPDLTVRENLELGGFAVRDKNIKGEVHGLIMSTFPRLEERMHQHAGTLSGGEQQMLAMGRALMSHPRLLLLDEPSMGLSPIVTREIFALIRRINAERKITLILVEQNAHMALEHSNRTYVMENGTITMEGTTEQIKGDQRIVEAYLGV